MNLAANWAFVLGVVIRPIKVEKPRGLASSMNLSLLPFPPNLRSYLERAMDGIRSEAAAETNHGPKDGVEITCFSEQSDDDAVLHFQIIRLQKQIYVWIGCNNSAKLGHLYATALPTRSCNSVGVTPLIGGGADNSGMNIARRLVLKTGLSIVLACNLPKNSPMLEANAEKKLVQKMIELGYAKPK